MEKHDSRFQSTLVKSGSVYEGTKVREPNEFDFMIQMDSLSNTPLLRPCDKGDGYVKLSLESREWEDLHLVSHTLRHYLAGLNSHPPLRGGQSNALGLLRVGSSRTARTKLLLSGLNVTLFAALHTCDVSWIGTFPNGRRLNVKKGF